MTSLMSVFLMAFLLTGVPQAGRQQPPPKSGEQAVRLRTDLVVLDAEVIRKKTGDAVGGLARNDFVLTENDARQDIAYFSQDSLPLSVLILLDVSTSVWPNTLQLRSGALKVLELLKPEDEVALMTFAGSPRVDLNFVKDKKLAAEAIRVANPDGLMGGTYIGEAVYQAAEYMQKSSNPEGRRVIIAISDDISTVKPPLLHSELETTHKVLESNAMVCELFFDSIYRHRNPSDLNAAVPRVVLVDAQEGIIETYVERTGGIALQADKANITDRFSVLIQRLRTRYSIGYVSSNQNRDGKFRKIKLKVTPEVESHTGPVGVITKRGYYAQ